MLYAINIDNDGDGNADISLPLPVHDREQHPGVVPLQRRPDHTAHAARDPGTNWNRQQTYTLSRVDSPGTGGTPHTTLGTGLLVPPCNIGPRSTPELRGDVPARERPLGDPFVHSTAATRQGVRRPARRRVLRRPRRRSSTSAGSAASRTSTRDPAAGLLAGMPGVNAIGRGQRALTRVAGSDHGPHPRGQAAGRRRPRATRSSASGPPPAGRRSTSTSATRRGERHARPARGSRCPGWATRWSTRC